MGKGMGSSLPTKKLDRSNYASWSYKRHQYQKGIMRNVLHVLTITKNLVSVGKIVDKGMQV